MEIGPKEKKQIIIVGVLVLVMLIAWADTLRKTVFKKRAPAVASTEKAQAVDQAGQPQEAKLIVATKDLYGQLAAHAKDLKLTRDPFNFALTRGGLKLIGIIWDRERPQAIINNIVVNPGDKISINKVIKIERDSVVLNDGSGDYVLTME